MKQDLTIGDLKQNIKSLALPASIGFLFHTLYNITDTFFAGQISTQALAALSLSYPIFFILLALSSGMSSAVNSMVSNALGSNTTKEKTANIAQNLLLFALVLAVVITTVGLTISTNLLTILGAEGEYLNTSLSYIDIVLKGSIFFVGSMFVNALLSAQGDMVSFRNILVFTFFLNVIFDYIAVHFGFGIKGIAFATISTEAIALIYLSYKLYKTSLLQTKLQLNFKIWKRLITQGIPATTNMFFMSIGTFIVYYYLSGFEENVIAAYGVGVKIEQLALLPIIGISSATLTMIAQNNGAKKHDRVEQTLKLSLRYSLYISVFAFVTLWLFGAELIGLFSDDARVIAIGTTYLRVESFLVYPFAMIFIYIALLQGIEKPKFIFYHSLLRQIVLPSILLSIISIYTHDALYIWLAIGFTVVLAALIVRSYALNKFHTTQGE